MTTLKEDSIFKTRRSIRRFEQKEIPMSFLKNCIESARLAPSAKNLQPLKYLVVTDSSVRKRLFSFLHWAGYLSPDWTPKDHEQPTAYIVVLVEKNPSKLTIYDAGIALAHIVLYAEQHDIGSCILQNIEKDKIQQLLKIPEELSVSTVVALGYKKEQPILETHAESVKYWLDDNGKMHVPKKPLSTILHEQTYKES